MGFGREASREDCMDFMIDMDVIELASWFWDCLTVIWGN
jgi:hypothetical protein